MPKDILFINPGNHKKTYQDLSREYTAIATPMWTSLLAGYARNKGFSTAIYDVNVEGWDRGLPGKLIERYCPQLIVIMVYGHNPSASTQTMPAASMIAGDIKRYNKEIPLAVGGLHPSALPERTIEEMGVDFIIKGEGPYSVEELIKCIKGQIEITRAPGICYRSANSVKFTRPASLIKDLDKELGDYAWDLLPDINNYRAHNMHCFQDFERSNSGDFSDVRSPYVAMNTSLGCPYSCSYCCINAVFGKPGIRYWSLEKVLSWIDNLVGSYQVRNIRFDDELFILSTQRVEKFCDLIIARGYDLNIWVYGRVDTIEERLLKKLKKAGVNWICLGIESGNDGVRDNVNKNIRRNIRNTVKMIQANGIYILGNYMFGLPEDNLETMTDTLELAVDLNCEFANFYSVMAYPGSVLYTQFHKAKESLSERWEEFSQLGYEAYPLGTRHLSPKEVLDFRDRAFYKYYTNSSYLNMIRNKFGSKAEEHIRKMTSIEIKRKLLNN